ncbi:MAG: mechanosensitive ion channel family protein [Nitrolancea sp.]
MHSVTDALKDAGAQALHNVGVLARGIPTFVIAILIVLLAAWIAQTIGRLLLRADRISPHLDPSLKLLIRQLIVAGIITFGVTVAFGVLGVSIATIIASFGVAGLIIGFALKDILENFVAGILILWRRPFEIADQIQIGTNAGTVKEINFRSTSLRTADGIEVLIPNALIFNQPIQNFTEGGSRRTTIVATVPIGTDLALAASVLKKTVESVDGVLVSPMPEVLLLGSTASDYQLHVRYWTAPTIQITSEIESAARTEILRVLASPELKRKTNEPMESTPGT